MRLRSWLVIALVVTAVTVVQASILQKQSIFRARLPEPCFTCRAEDRPFAYPLISFLGKMKDAVMKGITALRDTVKEKTTPENKWIKEIKAVFSS